MRVVLAALLVLCFLSTLEEIHSETAPYITFMGGVLPNHSYMDLALVGDAVNGSDNIQCQTDLVTCCSGDEGPNRGDWYAPGSQVGSPDYLPFPPRSSGVYQSRQPQRVDLRYAGVGGGTSGMYCCYIDTVAVHNQEFRETVYVGVYSSGGEDFVYYDGSQYHVPVYSDIPCGCSNRSVNQECTFTHINLYIMYASLFAHNKKAVKTCCLLCLVTEHSARGRDFAHMSCNHLRVWT